MRGTAKVLIVCAVVGVLAGATLAWLTGDVRQALFADCPACQATWTASFLGVELSGEDQYPGWQLPAAGAAMGLMLGLAAGLAVAWCFGSRARTT